MITSFRVGAIFSIVDDASPVIGRLITGMRDLTLQADRLKATLDTIGGRANFATIGTDIAAAGKEVSSLSRRMTTGAKNADVYALALDRAAVATRNLIAAGGALPRIPGPGGGSGSGGRGGAGTGHLPRGPHFGRIGGSLPVYGGHVHGSAPGDGGLIAGGVAGYMAYKAMHASEELQDEQDKMRRQGRSDDQIRSITDEAFNRITREVPTATASDVLKSTAELTFTTGTFDKGVEAVAGALKVDALIGNATGSKTEGQGFKMYRALEEKLVTGDKAHTDKLLGLMAQGTIATGGKVTGQDWFTFAKRAGTSWIGASDEEIATVIPTLIQSLDAPTAGTAYQTMHMALSGAGTLSKQQYEVLDSLHLINKDNVTVDKGGKVNVQPGGIIGSLETNGSQSQWGRNYLAPAIAGLPEAERESVIAKIGRNRNTMRLFEMFSDPKGVAQFDKDAKLIKEAHGVDESYASFVGKDPKGAIEAFTKQFTSMLEALGGPAMTSAMPAIQAMTTLFNSIASAANTHPKGAGTATSVAAGVAAGAAVGLAVGLVGGPVGAGGGALIGGALGLGWGILQSDFQTPDEKAAQRKARSISSGWFMGPSHHPGAPGLGESSIWGVSPAAAATIPGGAGGPGGGTTNKFDVTVKAETDDPHTLAEKIAEVLTKMMQQASLHSQGPGDGIGSSPYVSGFGLP